MTHELLLKGGHVIDPKNDVDRPMDVAVTEGKIAAVDADIPSAQAGTIVDVSGLYVTPGLVDIHCHLYATPGNPDGWAGDCSILPDGFSFRTGVTAMVDTGSAGWRNFEDFRDRVIDRCATRVFALVNIVGLGMVNRVSEQNVYDMDPGKTAEMALKHRDVVVGIKTAHYFGPEWVSVDRTIEAGERSGLPVMVDFGHFRAERPYHKLLTERLRPGDITTHVYLAPVPYLDRDGKLLSYLNEARERRVLFDVGHGNGSFVFRNAVPSVQQGFYPDTISTDLHVGSMNRSLMDVVTLMSKFLAMGMPLGDIVRACTSDPASAIGHPELGHLTVGALADIAVLNLVDGIFGFADTGGGRLEGDRRFFCEMTVKDGQVVWDWNSRTAVDYRQLGDSYGVRSVDKVILPES